MKDLLLCLGGLVLAVLGVLLLVRPEWFRKLGCRRDGEEEEPSKRYLAGSRLLGALLLLVGTVLFLVLLVALLLSVIF